MMTKQCMEAMQKLYSREARTHSNVEKAVIDEALDQLVKNCDSERTAGQLLRDALSNAQKKVYRYQNRNTEFTEELSPVCGPSGLESIGLKDAIDRAELTQQQRLILLRCEQGYQVREIALECGAEDKVIYRDRQKARDRVRKSLEAEALKKVS